MRSFYLILCLLVCVTGNVHAKNKNSALSMDAPAWSTTKHSLKRKGYRTKVSVPLAVLENTMLSTHGRTTKRSRKVIALSKRSKNEGLLVHRTAILFEDRFVKLNQVAVFSVTQRQHILDTVRMLEESFIGAPGVLHEAMTEGRSARWQYQTAKDIVRISILLDEEGGVLKIERSVKGTDATLEQYRRHLVARISNAQRS